MSEKEGELKKRLLMASERTLESKEWEDYDITKAKGYVKGTSTITIINAEKERFGSQNVILSIDLDDLNRIVGEAKKEFPTFNQCLELLGTDGEETKEETELLAWKLTAIKRKIWFKKYFGDFADKEHKLRVKK